MKDSSSVREIFYISRDFTAKEVKHEEGKKG